MMPHEDIDIPRLLVIVGPNHRVIATHLDLRLGCVAVLVYSSQHVNVRPGVFVPGVPLLVFDQEGARETFHYGVMRIFHVHRAGSEGSYVVLELDATHKVGKPRPETEAVEVSQQRSMMKADPAAASFVDVTLKCS